MPRERRQLNVRVDDETERRIARLLPLVTAAVGIQVTVTDLVRLGMIELERKYGGAEPPKKAARRRGPEGD